MSADSPWAQRLMFSSVSKDPETPDDLFNQLDAEFNFEVDVCADERNALCIDFYSEKNSALDKDWGQRVCWMNPVYGDPQLPCRRNKSGNVTCKKKLCAERGFHSDVYVPGIDDFMRKAHEQCLLGATVVALVPARTDTEWWHRYCVPHERRHIKGRLTFLRNGEPIGTAPFPSALVVMRAPARGPYQWSVAYPCIDIKSMLHLSDGTEHDRDLGASGNRSET